MTIALLHKSYNAEHLDEVKKEMESLGAPKIRAFWSDFYGIYMAVEGSHRLRAAQELGYTPEIIEVEPEGEITVQYDGEEIETDAAELFQNMEDNICDTLIKFEEEE